MITKLNTEQFEEYDYLNSIEILFMRPVGAKTFRVCHVPETLDTEDYKDVIEILNSTCKIKRFGIWFFDYTLEELQQMVMKPLKEMDIDSSTMEPTDEPDTLDPTVYN